MLCIHRFDTLSTRVMSRQQMPLLFYYIPWDTCINENAQPSDDCETMTKHEHSCKAFYLPDAVAGEATKPNVLTYIKNNFYYSLMEICQESE